MALAVPLVLTKKMRAELSTYLEAIAFPTLVINSAGKFLAFNKLAQTIFYNQKIPLNSKFTFQKLAKHITLINGKPYKNTDKLLGRLFQKPRQAVEFRLDLQKGVHTFSYRGSLGALAKEQEVWGGLVILRDITDELRQRNLQKTFIRIVGHELKQPLGLMKAYIYYLKRLLSPTKYDQKLDYIKKLEHQIEIMAQTFNDIVEATRFSMQAFSVSPETVDMMNLLHKTVDDIKTLNPNRQIQLPDINPLKINCLVDPVRTQQVLTNVLTNALKYSPEMTAVEIDTRLRKKYFEISITDHGQGIPHTELKAIFEPYFRSHKAREQGIKGLGLGLSLVLNIMNRQGGSVAVKSQLNKGATFKLSFPLAT